MIILGQAELFKTMNRADPAGQILTLFDGLFLGIKKGT